MASRNDIHSRLVQAEKGKVWASTLSHKMCHKKQTTEPKLLILVSFWEVCRFVFYWATLYDHGMDLNDTQPDTDIRRLIMGTKYWGWVKPVLNIAGRIEPHQNLSHGELARTMLLGWGSKTVKRLCNPTWSSPFKTRMKGGGGWGGGWGADDSYLWSWIQALYTSYWNCLFSISSSFT